MPVVPTAPAAVLPAATPTAEATRRHTIQRGDTLLSIAERYDTTVDAIRAANPGLTETALPVGVEIVIPPSR
jgi:LysM repeat protein